MDSTTPIGEVIAALEREIEDKRRTLATLKALLVGAPREVRITENGPVIAVLGGNAGAHKVMTVGGAAVEILRDAGRPLHGLRELLPMLQERGVKVDKNTLPTALGRQTVLKKVEPGVWAYRP